jgi:antitoxin component of MazEF toxin-antitoxin module
MTMKLEIRKVGDDILLAIPAKLVSELGWENGDVCQVEVHGDELRIVRTESAKHAEAMKIARRGMEKYRDTLATLAKS